MSRTKKSRTRNNGFWQAIGAPLLILAIALSLGYLVLKDYLPPIDWKDLFPGAQDQIGRFEESLSATPITLPEVDERDMEYPKEPPSEF